MKAGISGAPEVDVGQKVLGAGTHSAKAETARKNTKKTLGKR